MSFLKGLGKISEVVGSTAFLEGLATGAGTEMIRQERDKKDTIKDFVKEGKITNKSALKEFVKDKKQNDGLVNILMTKLKGDRDMKDNEVAQAASFLIEKEGGINNAILKAEEYNKQYKKIGYDPIAELRMDKSNFIITPEMISSSLTDEPDFVDYGKTGDMTALDKIGKWLGLFEAESAGEIAQKQLNANLILENYKKSTLPTLTGDPFTVGIIGDKPLTAELAQLKLLAKSLSDKKSSGQSVDEELVTSVNKKVELLQNIIDQDKDPSRIYPKDADRIITNDFLAKYIQTFNLGEKFTVDREGFYSIKKGSEKAAEAQNAIRLSLKMSSLRSQVLNYRREGKTVKIQPQGYVDNVGTMHTFQPSSVSELIYMAIKEKKEVEIIEDGDGYIFQIKGEGVEEAIVKNNEDIVKNDKISSVSADTTISNKEKNKILKLNEIDILGLNSQYREKKKELEKVGITDKEKTIIRIEMQKIIDQLYKKEQERSKITGDEIPTKDQIKNTLDK